jgi:hypothetical protein
MSKKHIAPQFALPGVPAPKRFTKTIAFQVTAEEWALLEAWSQSQYRGLVTPTLLVSDLFRAAMKEGRFS